MMSKCYRIIRLCLQLMRRYINKTRIFFRHIGNTYHCPLCDRSARTFINNSKRDGQAVIDKYHITAMGARPHYRCPWCGSSDKERLLWLYIKKQSIISNKTKQISILHIAPEKNIRVKLQSQKHISYISGDKFDGDARYKDKRYGDSEYVDITKTRFSDESFDILICNHVLEHIPDDISAMRELYRILKKGAVAILQVPTSQTIKKSIEYGYLNNRMERLTTYGQADHVRIYAEQDYVERLKKIGFIVDTIFQKAFLSKEEIVIYGLNPKEKIFIAIKKNI